MQEELLEYVELLENKVIPITESELTFPITRVTSGTAFVKIMYNAYYIGGDYSAIYALSMDSVENIVRSAIEQERYTLLRGPYRIIKIGATEIEFTLDNLTANTADRLIQTIITNIQFEMLQRGYSANFQYEYYIPEVGSGSGRTDRPVGGGGSGSGSGGSSGTVGKTPEKVEIMPEIKEAKIELSSQYSEVHTDVLNTLNLLDKIEGLTIGQNTYIPYSDFIDAVEKDNSIEQPLR